MVDDWVKTRILFWSLNAWITNLDFSNALSISECLISFTKRKLKIRTSVDTFFLLTGMNTPFSSRPAIFFCRDAVNDETTDSAVVLKMKLAVGAEYFLNRSRSRLIGSMNTIESAMRSVCSAIDSIDDSTDDSVGDSISDSIDEDGNSSLA
jgi:hypothetical protein